MDVTDHVGGLVRLGHGVKNGRDVSSDAGDELGADTGHDLGLGEDAGADVSDRLESDEAGDNVEVVSEVSGDGTCQAGGGSDGLGGTAADDSAGSCRGMSLGMVSRLEAVVDILATTEPLPRVSRDGSDIFAVVERHIVADAERGSVVEIDNGGTVSAALVVAEDENSAWLSGSDPGIVTCMLNGGSEREERMSE